MQANESGAVTRGQWLALTAALLGWMFDGFEQGLFPVVARPALRELLKLSGAVDSDAAVGFWLSMANATFLVGAATGGVVFGWLGDKLGRVRAMSVSILTYSICSALGGFTVAPWQMVGVRFMAALGMGGEWSLGVALVMEVWGGRSRALLAGLIGAAANVGYMLVALLNLGLGSFKATLGAWGVPPNWVEWRLLMVCAALPALLTFFMRLFVPESRSWEKERVSGATSSWASRDLLAVLAGACLCLGLLAGWSRLGRLGGVPLQVGAMLVALALIACCYLYPIIGYMRRSGEPAAERAAILRRMLLAALISSVPLLVTWGSVQMASAWVNKLGDDAVKNGLVATGSEKFWKEYTQLASGFGAVVGTICGALLAGWLGRRIVYVLLCAVSLGAVVLFYQGNTTFNAVFLLTAFLLGVCSAAFYGWLPLYLPELFPTRVRATGQGFGYNFGRTIAAVGVLQVPVLMGEQQDFARAGSLLALIYIVGILVIWLAPETKGQPLPE